ncbi:bifunctional phosphopantothenoylcysteine decarboxylase/phosphopantothenate--cysteine ligase CoaBC [Rickettsiales endosymbiont of Peranema trichophorum]|uniref:bifunctional phosphopantothenoylcysteine decarboxylase/phosphopantothenate--cysteine ligase CoaBC n=1 Tax=Rickettsiales endosymbiont of Peranema trichophorum TaxID=2486577 RepID=UPI001023A7D1|nr:bifunctional phosphopantothenoylcysteine decarboxylase/phosphopantothenate--cysteine ligase CoaBC [Rickettsiales endosymbiont of Peranema trichophorum]RZI46725.1 bifunctional phosphopantothenoylcysteine decarboxylase/phosphopantothenate--cysteine ligase CoaBC [Rickettsiales endosymbiont of Peranema trichophorum]
MINKKILLIVTGSVAAYKAIDLVRELEAAGYQLSVILTKTAQSFLAIKTLESLSRCLIYMDDIDYSLHPSGKESREETMLHIKLAQQHDLIVIAPASANFIAKLSSGFADTLSLSTILASKSPVVLAPTMNPTMFEHSATQDNISVLRKRAIHVIDPIFGQVACGDIGIGKYVGNQTLLNYIKEHFKVTNSLASRKAVITLGSTKESIDSVRFISNYSSGEQGLLIAEELVKRGCDVTIIAGAVSVQLPNICKIHRAYTALAMQQLSLELLPADIYIGCAAICDFKPKYPCKQKIKRKDHNISVEFEPNIDVIRHIGHLGNNRPNVVVGFALEDFKNVESAEAKLHGKNLNMTVLNLIEYAEQQHNDFTIISRDSQQDLGIVTKAKLAETLVDRIILELLHA